MEDETYGILVKLNAYSGDNLHNIWQDVIYDLLTPEEWEAAPDTSDQFTHNGVTYRLDPLFGDWRVAE